MPSWSARRPVTKGPALPCPRCTPFRHSRSRIACAKLASPFPCLGRITMLTFLLWVLLLVFCWPLALLALILYPIVWLLLLPFRLLGIAVERVLAFRRALVLLPARVLRSRPTT